MQYNYVASGVIDTVHGVLQEALKSCLLVNAPLLFRAANRLPFSVLKYAMAHDGEKMQLLSDCLVLCLNYV